METGQLFGVVAGVLSVAAFTPYFYGILYKGTVRPHVYSWVIWTLVQGTTVWIMYESGAGWGIAGLGTGAVLCVAISVLSLRYGTKDITRLDTLCLILALVALSLYALVKTPYLSLTLTIGVDLIGFVPTWRKAWHDPNSESALTWGTFAFSNIFSLLALSSFDILTATYPILLLCTETSLALVVALRRTSMGAVQ